MHVAREFSLHLLVQCVDDADGKLGVARMAADLREFLLAEFEAARGEALSNGTTRRTPARARR